MTYGERKNSPEKITLRSESLSGISLLKSPSTSSSMLATTTSGPERRPSIVYEEDIPITVRRGSVTIRITTDDCDSKKRHGLRHQQSPPLITTPSDEFADGDFLETFHSAETSLSPSRQSSVESNPGSSRGPSPTTPTVIISPSCSNNTLRVPGSGHSSSSSLDDQEDPRIILRRRSLPKARSTDFLENQMLLPMRMNFRRNTVTHQASQHQQQASLGSPVTSHSLALDNFIKGRRSSAGVAIISSIQQKQQETSIRGMACKMRRRLSDQVRLSCTTAN